MEVLAAISGDQLRTIVERVEHVEQEIRGPASSGCSQPRKHAPKWAAPTQSSQPKSQNHCDEVLGDAKKEIYLEAKANGFDVKILREVIRQRKQDPAERDEHESLVEVYFQAIKGCVATVGAKLPNRSGRARHGPGAAPS